MKANRSGGCMVTARSPVEIGNDDAGASTDTGLPSPHAAPELLAMTEESSDLSTPSPKKHDTD